MSALSTRPQRHPERSYDRLADLHDQIEEAQSIETEKERAARIARLKNEIETLEVAKVGRQHAADERVSKAAEKYVATRDNYVEQLTAFLSWVDEIRLARDNLETAIPL